MTTLKRLASAPEFPPLAEVGFPGFDVSSWFAFFVPAKTPAAIVRKIHADTVMVLREPAIAARLDQLGATVVASTPEELAAHLKSETEKWGPIIKEAGIRASD